MVNTCERCGDIIPKGSHTCVRCKDGGGVICPECGSILRVMHSGFAFMGDNLTWNTLFHCEKCHSDWEKEAKYIGQPVEFKRKFWG